MRIYLYIYMIYSVNIWFIQQITQRSATKLCNKVEDSALIRTVKCGGKWWTSSSIDHLCSFDLGRGKPWKLLLDPPKKPLNMWVFLDGFMTLDHRPKWDGNGWKMKKRHPGNSTWQRKTVHFCGWLWAKSSYFQLGIFQPAMSQITRGCRVDDMM